jgi:hypothetical protein
VDCVGRKVPVADTQDKGALGDVLRGNLVRQVNQAQVGIDAQRHALQHAGIGVYQSEIGGENQQTPSHFVTPNATL